jgi:hypothetical protein
VFIGEDYYKQNLNGTISPAFANLTNLRNLYLGDNNLTGSIPESLTSLAHLQILDVSNNNLSGEVPTFSSMLRFDSTGNALLGLGSSSQKSTSSLLLLAWILGESGDFYVYEDVNVTISIEVLNFQVQNFCQKTTFT